VLGRQDELRAMVRAGQHRARFGGGQRWCDSEPTVEAGIGHCQGHQGAEGVAGEEHRSVAGEGRHGIDGGHDVEPFLLPTAVGAFGLPDTAEVEPYDGRTGTGHRPHQRIDDVVVHVPAVEGVRMAHHGRGPRRPGQGGLGAEREAVGRLEKQGLGFGGHGADGTVAAVPVDDAKLPIKMLNDRLLVKIPREEGERRSSGGILIPATAQVSKRLVWAEVVGLGQNVRTVQVGDQVLFAPEDRYEVEVRGDDYIILRERDIHAVAAERVEGSTGLYL
jgi:chaperonin GroES